MEQQPVKRGPGRPRKSATEGTEKQVKKREYQRNYNEKLQTDIAKLYQMEVDCESELEIYRRDRKKLEKELAEINKKNQKPITSKEVKASEVINMAMKGKMSRKKYNDKAKDAELSILLK
tara:strand:+ start:112 stop:471 length:360 start_codon:yes stop_codon:yes gene_type:complete